MLKLTVLFSILFSFLGYSQDDCKAPDYLNSIEGFVLASCEQSEYNEYNFYYYDLKEKYITLTKSGKYYRLNYTKDENHSRKVSGAQICNNYYNAVKKIKGENFSKDKNFFQFTNNKKNIYMLIDNAWDDDDRGYQVYIIEEASMNQEIEISIKEAIDRDGKVALYGILFDTDKSTIKPESEKALQQIIDYLNNNPKVNIIIVGHTDMVGGYDHNIKLSKERAEAVKEYLIKTGKIDSSRLESEGVGPLCPVSTNEKDDGKQLNRRVEIVKKLK